MIRNAKQAITQDLKDPDATQFRRLLISDGQVPKLCGELNGKNSYGGYVGFKRFITTEKAEIRVIEGQGIDASSFERTWLFYCKENLIVVE